MDRDAVAARLVAIREQISGGHYGQALTACDELLDRAPDEIEAIVTKAWLLGCPLPEVSDPVRAVELIRGALDRLGDEPRLLATLGFVYESGLGDYASAAKAYLQATALGTGPTEYIAFALLWQAPGSGVTAEQARGLLEAGVLRHPDSWEMWRELGLLRWHAEVPALAISALEAAETGYASTGKFQDRDQVRVWITRIRLGQPYGL